MKAEEPGAPKTLASPVGALVLCRAYTEGPHHSPWGSVYTLILQPPADSSLTTCHHKQQSSRPPDLPACPYPSPVWPATLFSACVITALVSGSPQPMKSARDLQGTLLHNAPLLFVFPPAFYRIVGFPGALNPPHNEF